jgi:hypothetical protein
MGIKLYLDDVRPTPPGWVRAYTFEDCIRILQNENVDVLSLDHDLGKCDECMKAESGEKSHCPHIKSGYDVVCALEEMVYNGFIPPGFIGIHSDNSVGRKAMEQGIDSIYRIYENKHK